MPRFFERGDPAEREQRSLEAQLKAKVDQRVDNAVRLQTAEAKLAEARSSVEALALESDEAALDRALQSRRAAEDKLAALHGAAAKIGKEISAIEAQIDKVVDQRCRSETSAAVNTMADRVQRAAAAFDEAAKEMEAASNEAGPLIPEAQAVHQFVLDARTQLVPAVEMIVAALKAHARGVSSGHGPASLPRPAAPAPKLAIVPPMPPDVNIFLLQNLKFVAANGEIVVCGKNKRHDVPRPLAEKALAEHLALPLSDKRIRDLEYGANPLEPDEASCAWIGPPAKAKPPPKSTAAPVMSSHFEPLDRGPAYKVAIPRVEPVAMGSRNAPDVDEG
jgi:hypothetical protein